MKSLTKKLKGTLNILLILTVIAMMLVPVAPVKAAVQEFPLQLIGYTTINISKADLTELADVYPSNTASDSDNNTFIGTALWRLIAKVDGGDPATLNTALLGSYSIKFTGLNSDLSDYVKTVNAGDWSSAFTNGNDIQTENIFVANKVLVDNTSEFVELPLAKPQNTEKIWYPTILDGTALAGDGNKVGGLYKIELTGLPYTVTATGDSNGTAVASSVTVASGGSSVITLTPTTTGYGLATLTDNSADVTSQVVYNSNGGGTYTLTNVTYNHTIAATFTPLWVTLTASSSSYKMSKAEFKNITHTTITTHAVSSTGPVKNYSWEGVPIHTLINKISGITPSGYSIKANTADDYAEVIGPVMFGVDVDSSNNIILADKRTDLDSSTVKIYSTNGALACTSFTAMGWFGSDVINLEVVYTVTSSASGGTITANSPMTWNPLGGYPFPSDSVAVSYNGTQSFNLAPSYRLNSLTDNSVDVTGQVSGGVYTLSNITANHALAATFSNLYTINTSTDGNGTVVANPASVLSGGSCVITLTPTAIGYGLATLTDNGTDVTSQVVFNSNGGGTYTLTNVTNNHLISATFTPLWLTITAGSNSYKMTKSEFQNMPHVSLSTNAPDSGGTPQPHLWSGVPVYQLVNKISGFSGTNYSVKASDSTGYTIPVGPAALSPGITLDDNITVIIADVDNGVPLSMGIIASSGFPETSWFGSNMINLDVIYTVNSTASNGTISAQSPMSWSLGKQLPANTTAVAYQGNQTFTLNPSEDYVLGSLTDNGIDVTNQVSGGVYTLSNISANHTLVASFVQQGEDTYTISTSTDDNGTATANPVTVVSGGSSLITLTLTTTGYGLATLTDNGTDVTSQVVFDSNGGGTYTLTNITNNHTLAATFSKLFVTMMAGESTYKVSSAEFKNIPHNTIETHAINSSSVMKNYSWEGVTLHNLVNKISGVTPTAYSIKSVATDNYTVVVGPAALSPGINVEANDNLTLADKRTDLDSPYTITYYTANGTIACSDFSAMSLFPSKVASIEVVYTIGTSANNGTISANGYVPWAKGVALPSGMYAGSHNSSQSFTLTPSENYVLASLTDNGIDVTGQVSGGVYTLANISANHTLVANFIQQVEDTYTVSTSTDDNGTASANPVSVISGGSSTITITPDDGFVINTVTDNGEDVTGLVFGGIYTLTNITVNHTIFVTFKAEQSISIGLSPFSKTVEKGDNFTVELVIDTNTAIRGWQTNLNFDETKLRAISIAEGNFLSDWASANGDTTVAAFTPAIDNDNGQIANIAYIIAGMANPGGPTGSGKLCSITFEALSEGTSEITLSDVIVTGTSGNTLSGVSVSGNEITVIVQSTQTIIVDLAAGWNTFSTPISLDPDNNTLGKIFSGIEVSVALGYNAETQAWYSLESDTILHPCEAICVYLTEASSLILKINPELSSPPSKQLYPGWNLISLANLEEMNVDTALISIEKVTGDLTGYVQVISPEVGNQTGWIYITGQSSDGITMYPAKGYWIYMINGGLLAGFTTTPVK